MADRSATGTRTNDRPELLQAELWRFVEVASGEFEAKRVIVFGSLARLSDDLDSLETCHIPVRYPDAPPGSISEGRPREENAGEAPMIAKKTSMLVGRTIQAPG